MFRILIHNIEFLIYSTASHTCSLRLETKAGKQWRLSLVMFDNNYQPETHVADKCRDLFKIKEFSKKEIRVQDYINEFNNKNKNEIYNSNNVYNYSPSNNVKNKVFLAEYTVNACMADSRNPEVLYSSVGDILEIEIKQSPSEKTFLEYLIKFNSELFDELSRKFCFGIMTIRQALFKTFEK